LVERRFRPPAPNVLWVADITYLRSWEGWLYLAAVRDAYSRAIVGLSIAEHMRAQLVVDALAMRLARRRQLMPRPATIGATRARRSLRSLAISALKCSVSR
jgi:transposase InsO family protein